MARRSHDDTVVTLDAGNGPVDITNALKNARQHDELRSYVDRLVRLHEQKAETAAEIKDVAEKAQGDGFSKKALLVLVKQELETAEQASERRAIADEVERMKTALGMFADTPLGGAAMQAAAE